MELTSYYHPGAYNFVMATRIWKLLCITVLKVMKGNTLNGCMGIAFLVCEETMWSVLKWQLVTQFLKV